MKTLLLLLALLLPGSVLAEGVLTPAANPPVPSLYNYRSTLEVQDDFTNGGTTNLTAGMLGWTLAGGNTTAPSSTTTRIGLLRRDTSAVINTLAYLSMNGSTASVITHAHPTTMTWVLQLDQVDANTTIWLGAANSASVSVPNAGMWFEKRDADTNWFCVTRNSPNQERNDSGVAVAVAYTTFRIVSTSTQVQFYINDALVCTNTTYLPPTYINPGLLITNSAAAAKTVTVDYFELKIGGLTR